LSEIKIDTLVAAYVNLRNDLNAHRKIFKDYETASKRQMDMVATKILEKANASGVDSFKTEQGTAFKATKDFVTVTDWEKAVKFIIKHDLTQMFNKAVNKAAIKEYMAENENKLPPGVTYNQKVEIQVRKK